MMTVPPISISIPSSSTGDLDDTRLPSIATILQMVNIWGHVPVIVVLNNPNYFEWRMLFDSILDTFGLNNQVSSTMSLIHRDTEWLMVDQCIPNLL